MTQNIDIYAGKAIDDSYFYSEIPRDESAYIIKSVFMGAVEAVSYTHLDVYKRQ